MDDDPVDHRHRPAFVAGTLGAASIAVSYAGVHAIDRSSWCPAPSVSYSCAATDIAAILSIPAIYAIVAIALLRRGRFTALIAPPACFVLAYWLLPLEPSWVNERPTLEGLLFGVIFGILVIVWTVVLPVRREEVRR